MKTRLPALGVALLALAVAAPTAHAITPEPAVHAAKKKKRKPPAKYFFVSQQTITSVTTTDCVSVTNKAHRTKETYTVVRFPSTAATWAARCPSAAGTRPRSSAPATIRTCRRPRARRRRTSSSTPTYLRPATGRRAASTGPSATGSWATSTAGSVTLQRLQ